MPATLSHTRMRRSCFYHRLVPDVPRYLQLAMDIAAQKYLPAGGGAADEPGTRDDSDEEQTGKTPANTTAKATKKRKVTTRIATAVHSAADAGADADTTTEDTREPWQRMLADEPTDAERAARDAAGAEMAEKLQQQRAAERAAPDDAGLRRRHKEWRLQHIYEIPRQDADGAIGPMRFNEPQRELFDHLHGQQQPQRTVAVKGRQMGITTLVLLDMLDDALWLSRADYLLLGRTVRDANGLLWQVRQVLAAMHPAVRTLLPPVARGGGSGTLAFAHGSRLVAATTLRGYSPRRALVTEYAYYTPARAEEVLGSIQGLPRTRVVVESTPGAPNGPLHRLCAPMQQAMVQAEREAEQALRAQLMQSRTPAAPAEDRDAQPLVVSVGGPADAVPTAAAAATAGMPGATAPATELWGGQPPTPASSGDAFAAVLAAMQPPLPGDDEDDEDENDADDPYAEMTDAGVLLAHMRADGLDLAAAQVPITPDNAHIWQLPPGHELRVDAAYAYLAQQMDERQPDPHTPFTAEDIMALTPALLRALEEQDAAERRRPAPSQQPWQLVLLPWWQHADAIGT